MKKKASTILILLAVLSLAGVAAEIHEAAAKGDLAAVKALIEKDPSLLNAKDADGRTPLHWASREGLCLTGFSLPG